MCAGIVGFAWEGLRRGNSGDGRDGRGELASGAECSHCGGVMKLVRHRLSSGIVEYAVSHGGGVWTRAAGGGGEGFGDTGVAVEVGQVLAPVIPAAILCIGLNYRKHAEETRAAIPTVPVLFFKNPAAVQDPGAPIVLPRYLRSNQVDYECELAVVIGKAARNVPREKAAEYVLGYTAANDVSARDWQKEASGGQWCRGKSFDTFCPLGPVLVTPKSLPDPQVLRISTRIGEEVLQDCNTGDMIFTVAEIIEFLSASTTLLPGTVILTGTPHGVGMARQPKRFLQPGETVMVEIEGIGVLSNPVIEEETTEACRFHLPG